MPRFPRNYIRTQYFHIMTQGINKIYIFEKAEDIKYYIATMYKLNQEHGIEIIAYCIMNNHIHLLVKVQEIEKLSKYMQRLNTSYALYYNKKYERVGYVFRDRYKAEGIYSREHLYNCIKYIYDNPVKAGICAKGSEYEYSNYKEFKHEVSGEYTFIEVDEEKENILDDILKRFLLKNNIQLKELLNDEVKLGEIITILKEKNKVSLRKIAKKFNISREKIRKIYNK